MRHELIVADDADDASRRAAEVIARNLQTAVVERGSFTMAVSGGRSPWAMFHHLSRMDLPWEAVSVWQVDERIAPAGDPDRNLVGLRNAVASLAVTVHPMPVEELLDDTDLGDAGNSATGNNAIGNSAIGNSRPDRVVCDRYAASLPPTFDVIHLGLGPDGHTASLVPDDGVLDVMDRAVAITSGTYQGRRRMTLTYPALARSDQLLWLVTGADKRDALSGLLRGDAALPASAVLSERSTIVADAAAAALIGP